jgi:hypothetical protein
MDAADMVQNGASLRELVASGCDVAFAKMLIRDEPSRKYPWPLVKWVIYNGPDGEQVGRQYLTDDTDVYFKKPGRLWRGYDRHKAVILHLKNKRSHRGLGYMKLLADWPPHMVFTSERAYRQLVAKEIIMVAPKNPVSYMKVAVILTLNRYYYILQRY